MSAPLRQLGYNVAHLALWGGHLACAKALIGRGVDVSARTKVLLHPLCVIQTAVLGDLRLNTRSSVS